MQIKINCIKINIILNQSPIGWRTVEDGKRMPDACGDHDTAPIAAAIADGVAIADPRNSAMQQHYSSYQPSLT